MTATLELARQLLGFNTINPPGSEADCMRFFADWLDDSGFEVSLSSFGEGRCNLIASLPGAKSGKPLAFTGHLDTVPLGNARWQYDPFGSQMEDGRLYGRGSSDMKAAIAAFAVACVHQREAILAGRGAVLLITGGEETGCDGVIRPEHMLEMKEGAILCNAGHFDVEVDVAGLRALAKESREVRHNIEGFLLPNGRTIYLLAEGRLVNLAAGDGHPAEIMDMSFVLQAECARRMAECGRDMKPDLYSVPVDIDKAVATRKLTALGVSIDVLSEEQKAYLGV